jgi:cobalt-zinc-cadmium efflux system membrane fusion protein
LSLDELCEIAPNIDDKTMKSRPHYSLSVLGLLALFASAGNAFAASSEPAPLFIHQGDRIVIPADSPLRKRLLVAEVGAQGGAHGVAVPAMVEADPSRVVAILPPLTGRLVELKVGLGDTVRRGEPLAVISSPDFGQAQDDAVKAADALDLANKALERARGVMTVGANATKDIESAESTQRQALAEDQRARDRLATLEGGGHADVHARGLVVVAPANGSVTALNVGVGSYINDATAPLMTVSGLDRVWITAQVPEQLVAGIAPGGAVDVTLAAYPGQTLHGKVARVSPVIEADTRRAKVRMVFDNADGRLKPNMFATATFALPQAASVTVPPSALLMNNDSTTVLVEVAPWTFTRRVVELGSEDSETVRIVSGLKRGERVVTRGGVLLND